MTRTALYRHYAADGALLYVGITDGLSSRDKQHRASKHWHDDVAETRTAWFPIRSEAQKAETKAILQERPLHNVMAVPVLKNGTAQRVVEVRSAAGLSQSDFADMIGVKRSRLSLWECGVQRLSLSGALAIRDQFGVSLDWLYPSGATL
jgi:DNA-binding transcriptional regulator YiaG